MLKGLFVFGSATMYAIMIEIAVFGLLNILSIVFFSRLMLKGLINRIDQLDLTLADAIKSVLEGNFELPDQVTPIQAFLMDLVKSNLQKSPDLGVLSRDDSGKFA